jgi:adenylate cyclase
LVQEPQLNNFTELWERSNSEMHRSKIILILLLTFNFSLVTVAQQTNLDSLYSVWQDETQPDSSRTTAYKHYIWNGFLYSNPDSAIVLAQTLLTFGEKHQYAKANALSYRLIGVSNALKSNYSKALDYCQRSLKIFEELGDKKGIATLINGIGILYNDQGDYTKALDYYQRSLKIYQDIEDKGGSASVTNNIGLIYSYQEDYPKALNYFQRSLKIFQEFGEKKGSATCIVNIGNIYVDQGDYSKALDYFQRSLNIFEVIGDYHSSAISIGNIGSIYFDQGDYSKALDYFQHALKISEEIGDKKGSSMAINHIGLVYEKQGDYPEAVEYCKKALLVSQEIGALDQEKAACQCLYDTYKAMGNGNEALVYLEKIQVIDDSLKIEETTKKLQQMEFAKQVFADSIAGVEKERLVEEAHQEEVRQKNQTRNLLIGGGVLLLLLAGGIYSRLRYVRKSKASLQVEKARSDDLLLNILPADIAAELKANGKAEARDFDTVSILFTDFKEFTQTSEKLSAQELVSEINTCFEAFDAICEKYKVEKIKTIGDSYMGAGGLPIPSDDSAKNTVKAAIEMQSFITKRKVENEVQNKPAFEMRVGIHTGPVVAGIVGVKKFQYDIWGDTVNTASRMESNGEVGKVNVSQSTYELIKSEVSLPAEGRFEFESRGKIEAKGKGEIEMYFVALSS